MLRVNKKIKLSVLAASLIFVFLSSNIVFSATQNINVNVTVPGASGCSGCTVGDITPPVVTNVSSTPGTNTSTVKWMATDESGIRSCFFYYGLNDNNNITAAPVSLGGNYYGVDLTGLATSTVYTFQLFCQDNTGNNSTPLNTGSFATLGGIVHSLTVWAKPEKRVSKTGGNDEVNVTLLIYDPGEQKTVFSKAISLNSVGSSTQYNVPVPVGHNLQAILKGESHLAKKIVGVNIVNGQDLTLDFTDGGQFELLAGDVAGTDIVPGLKDNFVDILDVSAEDVKFNSQDLIMDLNRDGIVDVLDVSVLLVNFNKAGDAIPTT